MSSFSKRVCRLISACRFRHTTARHTTVKRIPSTGSFRSRSTKMRRLLPRGLGTCRKCRRRCRIALRQRRRRSRLRRFAIAALYTAEDGVENTLILQALFARDRKRLAGLDCIREGFNLGSVGAVVEHFPSLDDVKAATQIERDRVLDVEGIHSKENAVFADHFKQRLVRSAR